jgi:hypothetical protein
MWRMTLWSPLISGEQSTLRKTGWCLSQLQAPHNKPRASILHGHQRCVAASLWSLTDTRSKQPQSSTADSSSLGPPL